MGNQDKEISIVFVDDKKIKEINSKYLNRDYPTNVISFPMREGAFSEINPYLLGDIVISVETAIRDAQEASISPYDEILFLLIHGFLHLIGYDHEKDPLKAKEMEAKEKELFDKIKREKGETLT